VAFLVLNAMSRQNSMEKIAGRQGLQSKSAGVATGACVNRSEE
jgi:hypothetical protein